MTGRNRQLFSLAAATAASADRMQSVRLAAEAGYDAVGLRFDQRPPSGSEVRSLHRALTDAGLGVLDIEVIRIRPGDNADATQRLVEWGVDVGAGHLLVVSDDADPARTVARFAETCEVAGAGGMVAVLEFMRFTAVPRLADAVAVVQAAGHPAGAVLVDLLHLVRSGSVPADLLKVAPALLPYAQLCDAGEPGGDPAHEARHARMLPGEGSLPLAEFVDALPLGIPLSIEVASDRERERRGPRLARDALVMARSFLGGARPGCGAAGPGREVDEHAD